MSLLFSPYSGILIGLIFFLLSVWFFENKIRYIFFYNTEIKNPHKFIRNKYITWLFGGLCFLASLFFILNNVAISFDENNWIPLVIVIFFLLIFAVFEPYYKIKHGIHIFDLFWTVKLRFDSPLALKFDDIKDNALCFKKFFLAMPDILRKKFSSELIDKINNTEFNNEIIFKFISEVNNIIENDDLDSQLNLAPKQKKEVRFSKDIDIYNQWKDTDIEKTLINHLYIKEIISDILDTKEFGDKRYQDIGKCNVMPIIFSLSTICMLVLLLFAFPSVVSEQVSRMNDNKFKEQTKCDIEPYLVFNQKGLTTEKRNAHTELIKRMGQKGTFTLIYGKAGAGKTSIVKRAVSEVFQQNKEKTAIVFLEGKDIISDNDINYENLIVGGLYNRYLKAGNVVTNLIFSSTKKHFKKAAQEIILRAFRNRNVIFIVDELEQINASTTQMDLVDDILAFANKDKKKEMRILFNPTFILTSRISEKKQIDNALSKDMNKYNIFCYEVSDLTRKDVETLIGNKLEKDIYMFRKNITPRFIKRINYQPDPQLKRMTTDNNKWFISLSNTNDACKIRFHKILHNDNTKDDISLKINKIINSKDSLSIFTNKEFYCLEHSNLEKIRNADYRVKNRNIIDSIFPGTFQYKYETDELDKEELINIFNKFLNYYNFDITDQHSDSYRIIKSFYDVEILYDLFMESCLDNKLIVFDLVVSRFLAPHLFEYEYPKIIKSYYNCCMSIILKVVDVADSKFRFGKIHIVQPSWRTGRGCMLEAYLRKRIGKAAKIQYYQNKTDKILANIQEGNIEYTIEQEDSPSDVYPLMDLLLDVGMRTADSSDPLKEDCNLYYMIKDDIFRDFFKARALFGEVEENLKSIENESKNQKNNDTNTNKELKEKILRQFVRKFERRDERTKNFVLGFSSDNTEVFPALLKATIEDYSTKPLTTDSINDWEGFLTSLKDPSDRKIERILEFCDYVKILKSGAKTKIKSKKLDNESILNCIDENHRKIISDWNYNKKITAGLKEEIINSLNKILPELEKSNKTNVPQQLEAANVISEREQKAVKIAQTKADPIKADPIKEDRKKKFNNKFNETVKYLYLSKYCKVKLNQLNQLNKKNQQKEKQQSQKDDNLLTDEQLDYFGSYYDTYLREIIGEDRKTENRDIKAPGTLWMLILIVFSLKIP